MTTSPRDAARAATELGGDVAVKAVASGLVTSPTPAACAWVSPVPPRVQRAARELAEAVRVAGHEPDGFLVQAMAPAGTELLVGVVGDPSFGPLIAVGAGGETAELVGDVQVRLAPVGPREAAAMLRALRTFPLLDGFRGRPQADMGSVEDIVQRVARLAADHPAIAELDCNPVIGGAGRGARRRRARPPRRPSAAAPLRGARPLRRRAQQPYDRHGGQRRHDAGAREAPLAQRVQHRDLDVGQVRAEAGAGQRDVGAERPAEAARNGKASQQRGIRGKARERDRHSEHLRVRRCLHALAGAAPAGAEQLDPGVVDPGEVGRDGQARAREAGGGGA